jgi:hypothetical protein
LHFSPKLSALALRAAGSFLAINRDWSVPDYIEALTDERQRVAKLKGPDDPDLDVHAVRSLSASQLQDEEPALSEAWSHLIVFAGTFDRAAAAAVWNEEESAASSHGGIRPRDESLPLT